MPAREYFADVRRASARVEECQRTIGELTDGLVCRSAAPGATGRHGVSDPTYAAMVERARLLGDAMAERDMCQELIGEALAVIEGLRRVFSRKADVLELYYVDCLPWPGVAAEMGMSERTTRLWRDELCAWMDQHPRAYVMGLRCE